MSASNTSLKGHSMPTALIRAGIISRSQELANELKGNLEGIAECIGLGANLSIVDIQQLDIVIVFILPPYRDEVRLLARVRASVPTKPILLVTEGLDTNQSVELLKAGISDIVTWKSDPRLMIHKLLRAVRKSSDLVLSSPVFQALMEPADPLPVFINRRATFRATLPPSLQAYVVLCHQALSGCGLWIFPWQLRSILRECCFKSVRRLLWS
jgi:CheY-like chemotaxis protein